MIVAKACERVHRRQGTGNALRPDHHILHGPDAGGGNRGQKADFRRMYLVSGACHVDDAAHLRHDGGAAVNDLRSHLRRDIVAHVQHGILREQHAPLVPPFRVHEPAIASLGALNRLDCKKLIQCAHT